MRTGNLKSFMALASLCLFVFGIWCLEYKRTTPASWQVPVEYYGDTYIYLGFIKAIAQGDCTLLGVRQVHRVNAPGVADWQNYPFYEKVPMFALGMVARYSNLAFASNVGLAMATLTAAAGFWMAAFFVLKCSRWWSWVGGAVFSLLYYQTWRGCNHLLLGYVWTIPLFVAATWAPLRARWLLLIAFAVGISNPYWVLGAMILVIVCHQPLRTRFRLYAGLASGFILSNLVTILYRTKLDLVRTYAENERFAFRPMELLLPPPGGLFRGLSQHWLDQIPTWLRGELFSPYLGIVGVMAIGFLLWDWFHGKATVQFAQVCGLVICSSIGGLTCLMALCGLTMFRASNRLSEFVAAVCLLWLTMRLSNIQRKET